MSYSSFIKRELEIIGEDLSIMPKINQLLKIIDGQGHSGASIGIFSGWFKTWAENPEPVTDKDSLLFEVSETVKDLPLERRKHLLNYVSHAVRFMPLSPLTGEDDEWGSLTEYGDDGHWQNKRMSSVFKNKDGSCHRLDMVHWAYPGYDFRWWSSWNLGGGLSSKDITFPYDPNLPENQPITRYFQYDGWEHELPPTIDPHEWLKWQHQVYLKGIDPRTAQVRESAMFVQMDGDLGSADDQTTFFGQLIAILCALKYSDEWSRQDIMDRLRWMEDGEEGFTLEWSEQADEGEDMLTYKRIIANPAIANSLARMIALIPEHWQFMVSGQQFFSDNFDHSGDSLFWDPVEGKEYCLYWRPVWVTDRNYQKWLVVKANTAYVDHTKANRLTNVVVPDYKEQGTDGEAFYYDKPYQVTGDEDSYLYQKRRELGLAHPKRKTLTLALPEKCSDPEATVDAVVSTFNGEEPKRGDFGGIIRIMDDFPTEPPLTDLTQGGPITYTAPFGVKHGKLGRKGRPKTK